MEEEDDDDEDNDRNAEVLHHWYLVDVGGVNRVPHDVDPALRRHHSE